jgi:hypothetical protein
MEISRSFWAPAIRAGLLSRDEKLIQSRYVKIVRIALAALVASAFALIHRPTTLKKVLVVLTGILFIAAALLTEKIETRRADKAIDENAFRQYMSDEQPSNEVMEHIRWGHITRDPTLVRRLIDSHADLNKFSERGIGVVSDNMDIETLQLLIDHGINLRARSSNPGNPRCRLYHGRQFGGWSGFEEIVSRSSPVYLTYVLQRRLVKVEDFSPNEQVRLWTMAGSKEAIQQLVNYGFDINAIDSDGLTAVQNLIRFPDSFVAHEYSKGDCHFGRLLRTRALVIDFGADCEQGDRAALDRMLEQYARAAQDHMLDQLLEQ